MNIDHACGLASLLKVIGGRLGIFNIPNIVDIMVYDSYDTVNQALGDSVVVERSLVPGLLSRAILIGSIPYASIEDIIVSVVVNRGLSWYIAIIRELMRNSNVRNSLRWEWINEVLNRFGVARNFNEIISQ